MIQMRMSGEISLHLSPAVPKKLIRVDLKVEYRFTENVLI